MQRKELLAELIKLISCHSRKLWSKVTSHWLHDINTILNSPLQESHVTILSVWSGWCCLRGEVLAIFWIVMTSRRIPRARTGLLSERAASAAEVLDRPLQAWVEWNRPRNNYQQILPGLSCFPRNINSCRQPTHKVMRSSYTLWSRVKNCSPTMNLENVNWSLRSIWCRIH